MSDSSNLTQDFLWGRGLGQEEEEEEARASERSPSLPWLIVVDHRSQTLRESGRKVENWRHEKRAGFVLDRS